MSNVLGDTKQQQVLALGRLGWSLRRIEEATTVRRETASAYLKAAGIPVRERGGRPSVWPPKPATTPEVSTDPRAPKPATTPPVSTDSSPPKPAISDRVSTDPASSPGRAPSASACEPYRELIAEALGRGRNAMAIWQDLIDDHGFPARYASVRRFVVHLRDRTPVEARVVITTAPGEEGQVDYGDQPMVSYTYDATDRLTQIAQGAFAVGFAYDAANRRTSLTLPNGAVTEYAFDAASQVTGMTYKYGGSVLGTLTYEYDRNGNRTAAGGSWARTRLPQAFASASYDASNRMTQLGSAIFSYDANGNLASDGLTSYGWNARDQLISLSGAGAASFQYDGVGRRAVKNDGAATSFLYDGLDAVQVSGAQTSTRLLGFAIDEWFGTTDGAYPLVDGAGSTIAVTDAAGAINGQYTYEPYGGGMSNPQVTGLPFLFTGRESDATGLYYYRARYYSPMMNRFISEDPLGLAAGLNAYSYAGNNPLTFTDPSGLLRWHVQETVDTILRDKLAMCVHNATVRLRRAAPGPV